MDRCPWWPTPRLRPGQPWLTTRRNCMPPSSGKTTAPAASSTVAPDSRPLFPALVIVWSASQPHRVGEVAFFPFGERLYVGRGDSEVEKFAHFVRQRPGETAAVDPHEEVLAGSSISRRQLTVRSTGDELEMERVGRCPTSVNERCSWTRWAIFRSTPRCSCFA